MAKTKEKRMTGISWLTLIGVIVFGLFFIVFFIVMGNASTSPSSSSAAVSSASSSATSASAGLLKPILRADAATTSDPLAFLWTSDNIINLIFMAIALVLTSLLFVSVQIHKNSSHIVHVMLMSLTVSAYLLTKMITCYNPASGQINAAILYTFAFLTSLWQGYRFILEALDGDTDFRFYLATGLTIAFMFLGAAVNYSLLESYSYLYSPVFWGSVAASRLLIYFEIIATVISSHCDYDPNPIQLDEFGNPIDLKKGTTPSVK